MFAKIAIVVASLSCAYAGVIPSEQQYSPAEAVSSSYIQQQAAPGTQTQDYAGPAGQQQPVYENIYNSAVSDHQPRQFSHPQQYDMRFANNNAAPAMAYTQQTAPVVAAYEPQQSSYAAPARSVPAGVAYSPSTAVSHASFNGFGTQWQF